MIILLNDGELYLTYNLLSTAWSERSPLVHVSQALVASGWERASGVGEGHEGGVGKVLTYMS